MEPSKKSEAPAPLAKPPAAHLALLQKDAVTAVSARIGHLISNGELHLPPNYSAENALKAAWLAIQEAENKDHVPALQCCTPNSIANALLEMVVQGLNPAKAQCYFIVYGKTLLCQRSYFGTMALLRRVYGEQVDIVAEVVYADDEFAYDIAAGHKRITKHTQALKNIDDDKIVGVYCVIEPGEGRPAHTEIMTPAQVEKAWQQGQTRGGSPAHKGFRGEMFKKTVLSRGCKMAINSSDDKHLIRVLRKQEMAAAAAEMDEQIAEVEPELLELPPAPVEAQPLPATTAVAPTLVPPPPPPPAPRMREPGEMSKEERLEEDAARFEKEQAAAKPTGRRKPDF